MLDSSFELLLLLLLGLEYSVKMDCRELAVDVAALEIFCWDGPWLETLIERTASSAVRGMLAVPLTEMVRTVMVM